MDVLFRRAAQKRYRYSIGVVYNTFPLPPVSEKDLERLTPQADAVLAARANHPNATLADLYDPDAMPPDLRIPDCYITTGPDFRGWFPSRAGALRDRIGQAPFWHGHNPSFPTRRRQHRAQLVPA